MKKAILGMLLICVMALASRAQSASQGNNQQQQSSGNQSQSQGQQGRSQQSSQQTAGGGAPAPLFEGKSTLKSSRQGKETATAGFNGIGPDGSVSNSVLAANPSPSDAEHVAKMASTTTDPGELAAFDQQGNLNPPKEQ